MPPQLVTPMMRSRAKAVNFGIVYGIGAFSLAKDIGVSRSEADEYIKGYLRHYSGVDKYMHDVVEKAKKDGYAETMLRGADICPSLRRRTPTHALSASAWREICPSRARRPI